MKPQDQSNEKYRSQLTKTWRESDIMKVVSQKVQSKDLVLYPIINTNLTEDIIQHRFSPMFENLKSTRKKLGTKLQIENLEANENVNRI